MRQNKIANENESSAKQRQQARCDSNAGQDTIHAYHIIEILVSQSGESYTTHSSEDTQCSFIAKYVYLTLEIVEPSPFPKIPRHSAVKPLNLICWLALTSQPCQEPRGGHCAVPLSHPAHDACPCGDPAVRRWSIRDMVLQLSSAVALSGGRGQWAICLSGMPLTEHSRLGPAQTLIFDYRNVA